MSNSGCLSHEDLVSDKSSYILKPGLLKYIWLFSGHQAWKGYKLAFYKSNCAEQVFTLHKDHALGKKR